MGPLTIHTGIDLRPTAGPLALDLILNCPEFQSCLLSFLFIYFGANNMDPDQTAPQCLTP